MVLIDDTSFTGVFSCQELRSQQSFAMSQLTELIQYPITINLGCPGRKCILIGEFRTVSSKEDNGKHPSLFPNLC